MSKRRFLNKAGRVDPRTLPKGPNGRALCRWCSNEVPPRRRTFCSDECVHEHKLRTRPAYVRVCLRRRDKGVCAVCGVNTKELEAWCRSLRGRMESHRVWCEFWIFVLGDTPGSRSSGYWDADHIQPVAEGGGTCGLDNYQTLCIPCHKAKTAEQKRRATAQKQENKTMSDKIKPTANEMSKTMRDWMTDEDNNPHRLISATKLKELARAMDPGIRLDAETHTALCRKLAVMIKDAMLRCYDNKRSTIRPLDF